MNDELVPSRRCDQFSLLELAQLSGDRDAVRADQVRERVMSKRNGQTNEIGIGSFADGVNKGEKDCGEAQGRVTAKHLIEEVVEERDVPVQTRDHGGREVRRLSDEVVFSQEYGVRAEQGKRDHPTVGQSPGDGDPAGTNDIDALSSGRRREDRLAKAVGPHGKPLHRWSRWRTQRRTYGQPWHRPLVGWGVDERSICARSDGRTAPSCEPGRAEIVASSLGVCTEFVDIMHR
jgi:hypothetical protein